MGLTLRPAEITTLNTERLRYDVEKPGFLISMFVIAFGLFCFLFPTYFIFSINPENDIFTVLIIVGIQFLMGFVCILLAHLLWNKLSMRILRKTVMRRFSNHNQALGINDDLHRGRVNIRSNFILGLFGAMILRLIGFSLSLKQEYYIEGEVKDTSLRGNPIRNLRILDSSSTLFGISVLTSLALQLALLISVDNGYFLIIIFTIIYLPLLSILVPVIWIFEDAQVRTVDLFEGLDTEDIGDQIRTGLLSRILGFGGIFVGLAFVISLVDQLREGEFIAIELRLLEYLLFFLMIYLPAFGLSTLQSFLYLVRGHQSNVNRFRVYLSNFLPVGVTFVQAASPEITAQAQIQAKQQITRTHRGRTNYCKKCGARLAPDLNFCESCGNQVKTTKFCTGCGTEIKLDATFCFKCGKQQR